MPNDGDASYVKALTADLIDRYGVQTLALLPDYRIQAVILVAVACKIDSTDCKLSLVAFDGDTETTTTAQALTTSYAPVWDRLTVQPDTTAWNQEDFNATEWGVKSAGIPA